ncbi:MAG: hypothetical protein V1702_01315 [Candidatus Woesearchaeota archaeon]
MFVRIKRIKGQEYGYLVENSWTGEGTRQKVTAYLGKILRPLRVKSEGLAANIAEHVSKTGYSELMRELVLLELLNHSLDGKVSVDFDNFAVGDGKKSVVVALNDGFLCGHSLKKLFQYSAEEDYTGFLLADLITGAGIKVEKDVFVALFQKLQGNVQKKQAEKMDFYY